MNESLEQFHTILNNARKEIHKVLIGQDEMITYALIAIFSRQHVLVEGVPGIAKTLLVKAIAAVLDCDFNRIQFTPDLMPADITGTNVFDLQKNTFHLVKGPVFTSFLLADEINRAPAKTQSALLQAMQERQVTIDRTTHHLSPAFTVFATQNPIESEGTYPLPEAQKDRFMFKLQMPYPKIEEETELARRVLGTSSPEKMIQEQQLEKVIHMDQLQTLIDQQSLIKVKDQIVEYSVALVRHTRSMESLLVGAGPRATTHLLLAARINAILDGRDFVVPDDIKSLVPSVLSHRIQIRPEYELEGFREEDAITQLLNEVSVPR